MSNQTEEISRLYASLHEAQTLNQASELLNSALEVGDVVADTLTLMCQLINATATIILLEDSEGLKTFHAQGKHAGHITGRVWEKNGSSYEEFVSLNQITLISHLIDVENIPIKLLAQFDCLNTVICVPITANGQTYGWLLVIGTSDKPLSSDPLQITTKFAKWLGDAFKRSSRYKEMVNAEARYHALLDDSVIPIIIVNQYGIIQMANQSAMELVGYHSHQLMGESIDSFHTGEVFEIVCAESEARGDRTIQMQSQIVTSDDQVVPIDLHVRRTRNGEFQWMYRDISEELLVDQMRNDLTAMLVHDLKGPLTNILTSLEMLSDDFGGDEESLAAIMIQVASRSGQWLHHLVHSLLDVSQLEAGSPITDQRVVSVKEVVDSAQSIIAARLEAQSVSLAINIPDDFPLIYANQEMLKRVFLNLIDNALKFTPYGSTITAAAVQKTPDRVELSIMDEGPGVPLQYRDSIFNKFYRTPDNTTKGIGLGLAFCSLVVDGHGGHIWVDPNPGGAKFIFTMPVADAQSQS